MDILVDNLFLNSRKKPDLESQGIPGYFVRSTARANVEDLQDLQRDDTYPTIQTMIDTLYAKSKKNTQNLIAMADKDPNSRSAPVGLLFVFQVETVELLNC